MSPTIRKDCPCPNITCRRRTLCDECEAVRMQKGKVPWCRRQKTSLWDRLVKKLGR